MAFQFLCPQGHLLQADESLAGAQCQCPYCRILFIIPPMAAMPVMPPTVVAIQPMMQQPQTMLQQPQAMLPQPQAVFQQPQAIVQAVTPGMPPPPPMGHPEPGPAKVDELPKIRTDLSFEAGSKKTTVEVAAEELPASTEQELLHIPCPNGHVLETPRDMLGQDVMCPFCNAEFFLRVEDSGEYKTEQRTRREQKERRLAVHWLNWSIVAAVLVVATLLVLIFLGRKH